MRWSNIAALPTFDTREPRPLTPSRNRRSEVTDDLNKLEMIRLKLVRHIHRLPQLRRLGRHHANRDFYSTTDHENFQSLKFAATVISSMEFLRAPESRRATLPIQRVFCLLDAERLDLSRACRTTESPMDVNEYFRGLQEEGSVPSLSQPHFRSR